MSLEQKKIKSAVEAILFAAGEPLEAERIAQVLEVEIQQVLDAIAALSERMDESDSGVCILRMENRYQMCSRGEYAHLIREALQMRRNTPLSQAAFEVLAVIAYNQPVTRSFVEQVRGVDCLAVISGLCQKGLIEEKGRMDLPGRPLLYGTTSNFLRCFSLASLDELPALPTRAQEHFEEDPAQTNPVEETNLFALSGFAG